MASDGHSSFEETRLIELLETFLQADAEEANRLLEVQGNALLSDMAFTLLRDQIAELTDVIATLKQKLSLLEELRPQWEQQHTSPQSGRDTFASEAASIPLEYTQIEHLQEQLSSEQFIGMIERLQNLGEDEQTQLIQMVGQAEQFNDGQKMLFKQALQQMKHLSGDDISQLAGLVKSMPFEQFKEAAQSFLETGSTIDASIPKWWPRMGEASFQKALSGADRPDVEQAIVDYTHTLAMLNRDEASAEWARTLYLRGGAYLLRTESDRATNIEQAIADFNAALTVFTLDTMPLPWADIVLARAAAYQGLTIGNREQNLEQALADYEAVLPVFEREQHHEQWSVAKTGLAAVRAMLGLSKEEQLLDQAMSDINDMTATSSKYVVSAPEALNAFVNAGAYVSSKNGDRVQNMELAIDDFNVALTFFKRETMPLQWAVAISGRGLAYLDRFTGDKRKNVQQAFDDLDAALAVLGKEQLPEGWASIKMGRASASLALSLLTGDQGLFLEQTLRDCDDVLQILTRESRSEEWASALQIRAMAYTQCNVGNRAENIEQAIADANDALTILTRERMPADWAQLHLTRGNAYFRRPTGPHEKNIAQAISDYDAALTVYTKHAHPTEWAQTLSSRNMAYQERNTSSNRQSIEQMLTEYEAILSVLDPEKTPIEWASAHVNCGNVYLINLAPLERNKSFEKAREHFTEALRVLTRENTPLLWAQVHVNLGILQRHLMPQNLLVATWSGGGYAEGLSQGVGNLMSEVEDMHHAIAESITSFTTALTILTPENAPFEWATAHRERATAYLLYGLGDRKHALQAIADFDDALTVITRESRPLEWAMLHYNRAHIFLAYTLEDPQKDARRALQDLDVALTVYTTEGMPANYRRTQTSRSLMLERLGHWEDAHEALLKARQVQRDLVASAPDEQSRADFITSIASTDMYLRDAQILLRCAGMDLAEVAIALEEGRAQSLRVVLDLDSIDPKKIVDASARKRAEAFLAARNLWRKRQHEMLASLPLTADPIEAYERQQQCLENLQLAYEAFLQTRTAIRQYDNPDFMTPVPTLEGIASCISAPGEALVYLTAGSYLSIGADTAHLSYTLTDGQEGGMAIIVTRSINGQPQVQHLALPKLSSTAISLLLNQRTQRADTQESALPILLKQAVQTLGDLGLNDLAAFLSRSAIRKMTVVAYGRISLFPLPAVQVRVDGKMRCMGDLFEITFAPSAHAANSAQQRMEERTTQRVTKEHPALLVAGDPQPSVETALPFAAVEANTVYKIALEHGYPSAHLRYLKPDEMRKESVIAALVKVRDAHLAVHGEYTIENPRQSRLILAGDRQVPEKERTISLDEALNGNIDLSHLRTLVLSACKTSITDMRSVPNEVIGLSAGFLQAGAACVVASLWSVDDQATYLLMTRFAQLYLDPQGTWSPARALAEAQRWLREEVTNSFLANYEILQAPPISATDEEAVTRNFYNAKQARMHKQTQDTTPDALPYADPIYWAAFVVTGGHDRSPQHVVEPPSDPINEEKIIFQNNDTKEGKNQHEETDQSIKNDGTIDAVLDILLDEENWEAIHQILHAQEKVLCSDSALAILRNRIILAQSAQTIGHVEYIELYLHLLENMRSRGVDSAHLQLLADLRTALQAVQIIMQAPTPDDLYKLFEEQREILLSRMTFALLYKVASKPDSNREIARLSEQRLRWLDGLRQEQKKTRQEQKDKKTKNVEESQNVKTSSASPQQANVFDPSTADLVRCAQTFLANEQERKALLPLLQECERLTRVEEMPRRIGLLTEVINRIKRETAPILWALLHSRRAATHSRNVMADMLKNREFALTDYNNALTILMPTNFLHAWMQAMEGRATAYVERVGGDQHTNIEQALTDLNTVLAHISRESQPLEWAQVHVSRGSAYRRRLAGDLGQNAQQALADFNVALTIFTRSKNPLQWAAITMMRGGAHANALLGDRLQHMEQAITDYNDALTILTRTQAPLQWAATLMERANVYTDRVKGDREHNIEQAIADYNAALSVFTRTAMPQPWAQAMQGRAIAYRSRIQGDAHANVVQALSDLNAALTIVTREQMPGNWAVAMMERGNIYQQHSQGDQEQNLERALSDYKEALSIMTRQQLPLQWACLLWQKGNVYMRRSVGERGRNIELALHDYEQASTVLSEQRNPLIWGGFLVSRGQAYRQRIAGDHQQNLQKALADFTSALSIVTRESMPAEWAEAHKGRGLAYMDERLPEREKNVELALLDIDDALSYFHFENSRYEWLELILVQGAATLNRSEGDRGQNVEKALVNFDRALTILTVEQNPEQWARIHGWRATAYLGRVIGNQKENLEQAIADCNAALTIFSPDTAAIEWSWVLNLRAFAYTMLGGQTPYGQSPNEVQQQQINGARIDFEAALTMLSPERDKSAWAMVHAARARLHIEDFTSDQEQRLQRALDEYDTALSVLSAEYTPFDWALTLSARGNLYLTGYIFFEPREEWAERGFADLEMATSTLTREAIPTAYAGIQMIKAVALMQMKRWHEAHRAFVEARESQRNQVKVAMTDVTRAALIAVFAQGDVYLRDALCMLHFEQPDLTGVVIALEEGRAQSLRVALDLDSILPEQGHTGAAKERIEQFIAARILWQQKQLQITQSFALETSKAGIAILKERFTQELDAAYTAFIRARDAIRAHDDPDFMIPMPTLEGIARAVSDVGEALVYLAAGEVGMALIVTRDANMVPHIQHLPLLQLTDQALSQLFERDQTKPARINVTATIQTLGELGLSSLATHLRTAGIHKLILVPYGLLGLFPLPAVQVQLPNGSTRHLHNLFEVTLAPSARAAEIARQRAQKRERQRKTLLLAGNPQPSVATPLEFAEAESETIQRIAQKYAIPAHEIAYLKPEEITKERVVKALGTAREAHLALHALYRVDNPRRSQLILAGTGPLEEERTISLQEVLEGKIMITGLRLLTLSACETSIIDVQRVPNEVVSLAAGFLQAGAAGVIASLWSVDDYASFLLMTRFAQLYLDPQGTWSPARALAEAQRWLREEATNRVLATYEALQEISVSGTAEAGMRNLYTAKQAQRQKEVGEQLEANPDALPYADPIYWAAFVVTGC